MLAGFPPVSPAIVDRGFADFVERWTPILDAFQREGVVFGLEIPAGEIAYAHGTEERALDAMRPPAFGINFAPSHLHWQQVDPVAFLEGHSERNVPVHITDQAPQLDSR